MPAILKRCMFNSHLFSNRPMPAVSHFKSIRMDDHSQKILNKIRKGKKVEIKNVINAATEPHRIRWAQTYKVQIGEPNLTLRGGVKVSTSAASGAFALLGIFDIIREEKMSHYIYAPYVLEDQGGIFTLQMQDGGWFRGDSYWKNYISGPMNGQKSYTDRSEFDFWKKGNYSGGQPIFGEILCRAF